MNRASSKGLKFSMLGLLAITTLCVAGCGGVSNQPPPSGEQTIARQPIAMQGESPYFNATLTATVTVSRGFEEGLSQRRQRKIEEAGPQLADVFAEELRDTEMHPLNQTIPKMTALIPRGSPLPRVIIRLALTNPAPTPLEVEIVRFRSELGSFAVKPERITIEPGSIAEPEAMTSTLGVTSDDIPFEIVLRVNGQLETKTVRVKSVLPPQPAKKS